MPSFISFFFLSFEWINGMVRGNLSESGEEESLLSIDSKRWSIDGVRWIWDKDQATS